MKWKLSSKEKPIYESEVNSPNEVECLCKKFNSNQPIMMT